MWFEILAPFSIMVGSLYLGACATFWVPQLLIDRQFYRRWDHVAWKQYWFRDERLGDGNAYLSRGLERIPDEDTDTKDKKQ